MLKSWSPDAVAEYRFHPSRMWRFDWAFPGALLAIECDGGIFAKGRHSRGSGIKGDMEKVNAAACLGWRVLKFMPEQLGTTIFQGTVRTALAFQYKDTP